MIEHTAGTITSRSASITFPDGTTPDLTHPLNNYNINYKKFYTVTVKYRNTAGTVLQSPTITGELVRNNTYPYTVPTFSRYDLARRELNGNEQSGNRTTSFSVQNDTETILIYVKAVPFSFYKVGAVKKDPLGGAIFNLYLIKRIEMK